MRGFLAFLAALCLSSGASAQDDGSLITMEQRGQILGWEGVGRVDTPHGLCTGVLIARDVALTAAHCVFDGSGARLKPQKIVFRAGYFRGKAMAVREAKAVFVPEGYVQDLSGQISGDSLRNDVALLRLSAEISSAEAQPFRIFDGDMTNLPVSVVSYGRGREEVLSREAECAVLRRYSGGQIAFDCNVTYGSSGAPVFVKDGHHTRILSLISAGTSPGAGGESFGMELPALVNALMREMRNDAAMPQSTAGARRVVVGQRTTTGGARFVRP